MSRRRPPAEASVVALALHGSPPAEQAAMPVVAPSAEGPPPKGAPAPTDEEPDLVEILKATRAELTPVLADATNRLNQGIFEFQTALADLRLGVSASVRVEDYEDTSDGRYETALAFRKFEGSWCLVLDEWDDYVSELVSTVPLVKASRAMRRQAVRLLPRLVANLAESSREEIAEVEESVGALASLTAKLREAKS
jgi:hypothetical protein